MNINDKKNSEEVINSIKSGQGQDAPAQLLYRSDDTYYYRRNTAFLPHSFCGHIYDLCITGKWGPFAASFEPAGWEYF